MFISIYFDKEFHDFLFLIIRDIIKYIKYVTLFNVHHMMFTYKRGLL